MEEVFKHPRTKAARRLLYAHSEEGTEEEILKIKLPRSAEETGLLLQYLREHHIKIMEESENVE